MVWGFKMTSNISVFTQHGELTRYRRNRDSVYLKKSLRFSFFWSALLSYISCSAQWNVCKSMQASVFYFQ